MPVEPLPPEIAERIAARAHVLGAFGARPHYEACVSSTNDVAARLAEAGAPEGAWVIADEQTAGRGRRGRAWASPPGAGLYLSVVFRPLRDPHAGAARSTASAAGASSASAFASAASASSASASSAATTPLATTPLATSLLTLMAGVAAATGVRAATGLAPTLKWPNDLVIEPASALASASASASAYASAGAAGAATPAGGRFSRFRKLAGILAEASATGGELQFVIVGIGINLTPASYPPEVEARATSIEGELGRPADRGLVLVEVLSALAEGRRLLLEGGHRELLDRWRRLAPSSIGRRVRWQTRDRTTAGVTQGIDETGALLVKTDAGPERIIAGDLQWE